jgi:hypothetical protein
MSVWSARQTWDFLGDLSSNSPVAWLSECGAEEKFGHSLLGSLCKVSEMIGKEISGISTQTYDIPMSV